MEMNLLIFTENGKKARVCKFPSSTYNHEFYIFLKAVEGLDESDSLEVDEFVKKNQSHHRLYEQYTESIVQEYHHVESTTSSASIDKFLVRKITLECCAVDVFADLVHF